MFAVNTPDNIEQLTEEELLGLIQDSPDMKINKRNRLKLIKVIYSVLGFELTNDLILSLLSEPNAEMVLATAGAGKTTFVSVKIMLEKIARKPLLSTDTLDGKRVLCLVYNNHNVNPMKRKHKQLVTKLYASGIGGLAIDSEIAACTMHSFCETWKNEYAAKCGLLNFKLLDGNAPVTLMKTCVNAIIKKRSLSNSLKISSKELLGLYNVSKECLTPLNEIDTLAKFIDLRLQKDVVIDIFTLYEAMKTRKRVYDYTDMLYKVLVMLQNNADIQNRIQNYYEYITADEVQDFTPIMMEILKLIVGHKTPLVCIGDEDQSIYEFRGADVFNALNFNEKFENSQIFTLSRNRRCANNIVEAAKCIIGDNTLRFDKSILSTRPDGIVEYIPFHNREGQFINLVKRLDAMSHEEREQTVVCYRDRESSLFLSNMLEESGIPFNVISGYSAFSHELYDIVIGVLDMLYLPFDLNLQLNLYKVLPLTKDELFELLHYDSKKLEFKLEDDERRKHFGARDYGKYMTRKSFIEPMRALIELSNMIEKEPLKNYFPIVFDMINRYYWNWKKSTNDTLQLDNYFTDKVTKFFNSDLKYSTLSQDYLHRSDMCRRWNRDKSGVTLSTIHGLKGLEFKVVFIIDLEDMKFPNFQEIDGRAYSDNLKTSLKECQTRLMYVGMTRAIDELYMYYDNSNPSYYIKKLLKQETADKVTTPPVGKEAIVIDDLINEAEAIKPTVGMDIFEEVEVELELELEPYEPLVPVVTEDNIMKSTSSIEVNPKIFKTNIMNNMLSRL